MNMCWYRTTRKGSDCVTSGSRPGINNPYSTVGTRYRDPGRRRGVAHSPRGGWGCSTTDSGHSLWMRAERKNGAKSQGFIVESLAPGRRRDGEARGRPTPQPGHHWQPLCSHCSPAPVQLWTPPPPHTHHISSQPLYKVFLNFK